MRRWHISWVIPLPGRDMIEDTRRIKKITLVKYNTHVNVRAASAHVMQRSCFSTPTDPSVSFLFWDNWPLRVRTEEARI